MTRFVQLSICLTFIALITFLPGLDFMPNSMSYHDGQRLIEVGLLSLVLLFSAIRRHNSYPVLALEFNFKLQFGFILLLGLAFTSAVLSQHPRHAIIEISSFIGLAFLALFVAELYQQYKVTFIKWFSYALLASALLYMIAFFSGYILSYIFPDPLIWPYPLYNFDNVRSFNQYQLWLIAIIGLPLLAFEIKKNSTRNWLNVVLVCWWVLLFYSGSRGVLLAWAVGLIATLSVYRQLALPLLSMQIKSAVLGLISYILLFNLLPTLPFLNRAHVILTSAFRNTTDDRIALWNQAILLIKKFPYFGAGPMHYPWYNKTLSHPHNGVLQIGAEWGLVATFVILTIISYTSLLWLKKINAQTLKTVSLLDKQLGIVLFFTLVTNAAYSMVDGVIVMPISQVLMFAMVGLTFGYFLSFSGAKTSINKNKYRIRPLLASFVLVLFSWSIFPEIYANFSGSKYHFAMRYVAVGPRFWIEYK